MWRAVNQHCKQGSWFGRLHRREMIKTDGNGHMANVGLEIAREGSIFEERDTLNRSHDETRAQLERTMMAQFRTAAVLSALVLGMVMAAPASAEEDCSWYAQTSAKQEQENAAKACGLKGDGWSTDLKLHEAYCLGVAPDQWRTDVQTRQADLVKCGG